jgi:cytochrome c553
MHTRAAPGKILMTSCISRRKLFALITTVACLVPLARMQPACAQTPRLLEIVNLCAPCHGKDGKSGTVEVPNLAGQRSIYLREQLTAFRSGKRKHPDMKLIAADLNDREIDQLVIYYSSLP